MVNVYGVLIYLMILLIYYSGDYLTVGWNHRMVRLYRDLRDILGSQPDILAAHAMVWRHPSNDKYIKQLYVTDSCMQMQMYTALFAGYGNISISERDYNKRVHKLMMASPSGLCMYDPLSHVLHIKNIDGSLYSLFQLASKCAHITEAYPITVNHPRAHLQEYYETYLVR